MLVLLVLHHLLVTRISIIKTGQVGILSQFFIYIELCFNLKIIGIIDLLIFFLKGTYR